MQNAVHVSTVRCSTQRQKFQSCANIQTATFTWDGRGRFHLSDMSIRLPHCRASTNSLVSFPVMNASYSGVQARSEFLELRSVSS